MRVSKSLRSVLIVVVLLLALLPFVSLLRGEPPFRLGLDLAGGLRITYRPDLSTRLDSDRGLSEPELLAATKEVLATRLSRVLDTVPDVALRSDQRIVVTLPGTLDRREALETVGRTYRLTFRLVEEGAIGMGRPGGELFEYRGESLRLAPEAFSGDMLEPSSIRVVPGDLLAGDGAAAVGFRFQSAWESSFAELTGRNVGRRLAILIDDDVEWVGRIESAIRGTGTLRGGYDLEQAGEIATMLRSGSLPVSLTLESLETVSPTLGREVQRQGLAALGATLVLLLALIGVAYQHRVDLLLNGWLSLLALLALLFGLASAFGLTLDMVGIAAIVLSVGMGMDAFVLVFESLLTTRSSDAEQEGSTRRSRRGGSSALVRRAYSLASEGGALLHGNLTTLIVILLLLGSERLRSFAVFMTVGAAASVATIFLTRGNLRWAERWAVGGRPDLLSALRRPGARVGWLRRCYLAIVLLAALVLSGLLAVRGPGALALGDDFSPGTQLVVTGEDPALERALDGVRRDHPGIMVESQVLGGAPGAAADTGTAPRHLVSVGATLGETVSRDGGRVSDGLDAPQLLARFDDPSLTVESLHSIDGRVSAKRLALSLRVLPVSFAMLGVYFGWLQEPLERLLSASPPAGVPRSVRGRVLVGILVALALDLLVVAAAIALLRIPIELPVVGAALSIVGYSVNDSVVLWSQVRRRWNASRRDRSGETPAEVVAGAVDEVLSRAVLTSLSTMVPAMAILLVGVEPLRGFATVFLVGTTAGTLSSLFVVADFARRALELSLGRRPRERRQTGAVAARSEGA